MKILYYSSWSTNPRSKVLCADKAYYEELKGLFSGNKKIVLEFLDDGKSVAIKNYEYVQHYAMFKVLKNAGFAFSEQVQKYYDFLESTGIKPQNEPTQEQPKEQPKPKTIKHYICGKYACETTPTYCERCWYRRKFLEDCKPIEVNSEVKL